MLKTCHNFLQNDKILDWSVLKAFADNKINGTEKLKLFWEEQEKIVAKGQNAGYQHRKCWLQAFFPFPTMFSEGFLYRVVKSHYCVVKS